MVGVAMKEQAGLAAVAGDISRKMTSYALCHAACDLKVLLWDMTGLQRTSSSCTTNCLSASTFRTSALTHRVPCYGADAERCLPHQTAVWAFTI